MHEEEESLEGSQHPDQTEVVFVECLPLPVVSLVNNLEYDMHWQKPQAEVHPGSCHEYIAQYLNDYRSDVHRKLKNSCG